MLLFSVLYIHSKGQEITYFGDVKPILDRHCVSCHQVNEIGAMPLTTYEQVSAYGKMIQYVTASKLMPPWYADATYSHFANERILTDLEIKKISDWVNAEMAEGNEMQEKPLQDSIFNGLTQRTADLVIPMAESFEQYGIYLDQYQVFVLPTGLREDIWVDGIEFVPGNKKIVRFVSISVETSDKFESSDQWDPRYGYFSFGGLGKTPDQPFWYTWSPQQKTTFFEKGAAKFLPRGSKLIVHVHYGPTGRPQKDSSVIRLYYPPINPDHIIFSAPLINPYTLTTDSLFISAETKKTYHAIYTVPYDMEVMSLTPQANLLCRSWEVYAKLPGQSSALKLLKINDWNFNWKQTFHFETPLFLPEGTEIHALAQYDNTLDNPCNPADKPVDFGWGAHLFSELFFMHFEFKAANTPSPKVMMVTDPVGSEDSLKIKVALGKTYFAEIQIRDQASLDLVLVKSARYSKGCHVITAAISHLPHGNYTIKMIDKSGKTLAEQLFIKMRDTGL